MNKINTLVWVAVLTIVPLHGHAQTSQQNIKDHMLADLDIMKNTMEVKYAPAEWKKEYANWDLDEQIDLAKQRVLECPGITLKDYQRIVKAFFNSTRDYHVSVSFYSTEMAALPFRVQRAGGKYYLAWVFEPYFFGLKHPPKIGDEILTFDGRPVDEVVQELKKSDFGNPDSATDQGQAEEALTIRPGQSGFVVPNGVVKVTLRTAKTNKIRNYHMVWIYLPEEITSHISYQMSEAKAPLFAESSESKGSWDRPAGEHPFFHKDMSAPFYDVYKSARARRDQVLAEVSSVNMTNAEEDHFLGSKKSVIPLLGEVVWETSASNPFHAYIYLNPQGKRIGYVRIPHYCAGKSAVSKFAEIINHFAEETEALIVDQINNPGGDLFYMYALAATLTDRPLLVPTNRMTITQEDVYFALMIESALQQVATDQDAKALLGSTLSGYPVDYEMAQHLLHHFHFVITEWNAGRTFTDASYMYGLDYVQPHPKGHYAKPILLLVNELDYSCGDFFPALIQDNKRATLLGTRTAGAGGYVLSHEYPNLFGIERYRFTGSIAQRVDQQPIENLGITPDIEVPLTSRDLEENYRDYVGEVHKAVSRILSE